jgi:Zn-dependent oligopeptidase
MHILAAAGPIGRLCLPGGCKRDFVEVPSHLMELFWKQEAFFDIYYKDDPKLEELKKNFTSRDPTGGCLLLADVAASLTDLAVHSNEFQSEYGERSTNVYTDLIEKVLGQTPIPETNPCYSFEVLIKSYYDCTRYMYTLADVIGTQIVSTFFEGGRMNPDKGRAFLNTVLRRAGKIPSNICLEEYLNGPINPQKYIEFMKGGLGYAESIVAADRTKAGGARQRRTVRRRNRRRNTRNKNRR